MRTCETNSYGAQFWYLNGKYHRVDGPAVECANGDKLWYLNGEHYETKQDHLIACVQQGLKTAKVSILWSLGVYLHSFKSSI